jgi:hypothetical protein
MPLCAYEAPSQQSSCFVCNPLTRPNRLQIVQEPCPSKKRCGSPGNFRSMLARIRSSFSWTSSYRTRVTTAKNGYFIFSVPQIHHLIAASSWKSTSRLGKRQCVRISDWRVALFSCDSRQSEKWMNHFRFFVLALCIVGCQEAECVDMDAPVMNVGVDLIKSACVDAPTLSERSVTNQFDNRMQDTIRSIRCPNVAATVYVAHDTAPESGLPLSLTVSGPMRQLPSAINVGATRNSVVAFLGKPHEETNSYILYWPDQSEDTVKFSLDHGKVVSIDWRWYHE